MVVVVVAAAVEEGNQGGTAAAVGAAAAVVVASGYNGLLQDLSALKQEVEAAGVAGQEDPTTTSVVAVLAVGNKGLHRRTTL